MKDKDKKADQPQGDPPAPPANVGGEQKLKQGHGPICEEHNVACVAKSTTEAYTYYYCPTLGCRVSHKVLRPHVRARIQRDKGK